jgi:hypothetical protein
MALHILGSIIGESLILSLWQCVLRELLFGLSLHESHLHSLRKDGGKITALGVTLRQRHAFSKYNALLSLESFLLPKQNAYLFPSQTPIQSLPSLSSSSFQLLTISTPLCLHSILFWVGKIKQLGHNLRQTPHILSASWREVSHNGQKTKALPQTNLPMDSCPLYQLHLPC